MIVSNIFPMRRKLPLLAELPSPKSDMLGECLDMAGRGPGSIVVLVGVEGIEYID